MHGCLRGRRTREKILSLALKVIRRDAAKEERLCTEPFKLWVLTFMCSMSVTRWVRKQSLLGRNWEGEIMYIAPALKHGRPSMHITIPDETKLKHLNNSGEHAISSC
jgi:hypothetical protein